VPSPLWLLGALAVTADDCVATATDAASSAASAGVASPMASAAYPQTLMVANVSFFIWMPPLWPPPDSSGEGLGDGYQRM
jgi:hypothetical protein